MDEVLPPSEVRHVAVLPGEVIEFLAPAPGQTLVDATIGVGGHSQLLAKLLGPSGRLIGLDQDPAMLTLARRRLEGLDGKPHVSLVHANFANLRDVLDELGIAAADGVLADLGFCADQVETAERGFSFQQNGPLDMRLNLEEGEPAHALLSRLNERALADLFWQYGEERFSRRIARKIVALRGKTPVQTTQQLADLVRRCVPRSRGRGHRIDPATRVFQALRIAVNDELEALDRFLEVLPRCLKGGGRALVISFHSLEDRRVKTAFRDKKKWAILTRKPVQATEEEVRNNPRARSAKLRAARKMTEE